ncbi:MAG: hypothetical protein ABIJ40_15960 [Bacteroidota bacterium]
MQKFDLAIAYKWVYDKEFTESIEEMFQQNGLTTYVIHKKHVKTATDSVRNGEFSFKAFLDRGSDEDSEYEEIANLIAKSGAYIINPYYKVETAVNKTLMHKRLEENQINVPETILLPSLLSGNNFQIQQSNLNKLGIPFVVKPSFYSGGGEGVNVNCKSINQIQIERNKNPDDDYLAQEIVIPKPNKQRRIWFRCFWLFGEVVPSWWNDKTHIYGNISPIDFEKHNIGELIERVKRIAELVKLDYFSTEATINKNDELVFIDYVNDQCDMRRQSSHKDGVPDWIVDKFIMNMMELIKRLH